MFTVNALPTDSTLVYTATLLVVSGYWRINLDITIVHVRGQRELSIFLHSITTKGAKN
jgi:hypothetical protein